MSQFQQHLPDEPPHPRHRHLSWARLLIVVIVFLVVLIAAILWVLYAGTSWYTILPTVVLTALGIVISLFQWLFPIEREEHDEIIAPLIPSNRRLLPPHDSVFLFNVPLTDAQEFYGRERERRTLIGRTKRVASTSIVGERKIGKTWLLRYLKLLEGIAFDNRFRIGYVDATLPSCQTIVDFTTLVMKQLGAPSNATVDIGLKRLENFVRRLRRANTVPVLCIDEFEGLVGDKAEFDEDFFRGLRAIAGEGLVLVIASRRPLIDIVGAPGRTSGFFNIFEQLTLKPFTSNEAKMFAAEKSLQAHFTTQERHALLEYGRLSDAQWPPLRLQLVGKMLFDDKAAARSDPTLYRPRDRAYWQEFRQRLAETYQAAFLRKDTSGSGV